MVSKAPVATYARPQWLERPGVPAMEQEVHAKVQEGHDKAHHAEPVACRVVLVIFPRRPFSWTPRRS